MRKTDYEYRDQRHFGGNREAAILRDGEACVNCGMTREDHKLRYGEDITVDHIDGAGRYAKVRNNALSNLQTLCLSCHMSKDNRSRKLSEIDVINIRHMKGSVRQCIIAKMYHVSDNVISLIMNDKLHLHRGDKI